VHASVSFGVLGLQPFAISFKIFVFEKLSSHLRNSKAYKYDILLAKEIMSMPETTLPAVFSLLFILSQMTIMVSCDL
jgi:hypothetical protein